MSHRNVILLALSHAAGVMSVTAVNLLGGIVGTRLATDPSWATLPVAAMVVSSACFALPGIRVFRLLGRRTTFLTAMLLGAGAAALAAYAVVVQSFALFCLAAIVIGGNVTFTRQYRFAAAESVPAERAGRAISLVLLGGAIAAYAGPELAVGFKHWLSAREYAGSFLALALVMAAAAVLLGFLREPHLEEEASPSETRPAMAVLTEPAGRVALLAGVVAYGVMTFTMTATPLSMNVVDHYSIEDTAFIFQSHVLAMYLPSLITGTLMARWGVLRTMAAGCGLLGLSVGLGLLGRDLHHYWGSLVLLGVGWNFLFIGGTALLSEAHRTAERWRVQGVNDFLVYGASAVASLSAGGVMHRQGWTGVNLVSIPFLVAMAWSLFAFGRRQRRLQPES